MVRASSERQALGERLKRQRERRGITLQSISDATKVPAALFAGLERGDCSRWPAGLYGRAYVRAYAAAIGLNPDDIVEDFTSAFHGGVRADGTAEPVTRTPRAAPLRLGMIDEPSVTLGRTLKRAGLAAADLLIGVLLATIAHVGLNTGMWLTLALPLAYHAIGRLISDEPLLYWLFRHMRHTTAPAPLDVEAADVAVGDTTTAHAMSRAG
jgi:hypothetical protein